MTVLALSYALQTSLSIRPALALTEEQILMTGQSGEGLLFSLFAFSRSLINAEFQDLAKV